MARPPQVRPAAELHRGLGSGGAGGAGLEVLDGDADAEGGSSLYEVSTSVKTLKHLLLGHPLSPNNADCGRGRHTG